MFIEPSKLKANRILRKRVLTFDTPRKTHQNLLFVVTSEQAELEKVLKGRLFRPQQMMSTFTPRLIRPMNRKVMRQNQKEFYTTIKDNTNGKIKIGKTALLAYNNRNLVYNIIPEYSETFKIASKVRAEGPQLQKYMSNYMIDLISERIDEINYDKVHIVLPLTVFKDEFRRNVKINKFTTDPVELFLKMLDNDTMEMVKLNKVTTLIIYNPNAEAIVYIDLKDPELKEKFPQILQKIVRLNNFNNGTDLLDDEEVLADDALDGSERTDNTTKEEIKNLVLQKIAKDLKIRKLDDFEASTKDEQDLALAVEEKIDAYLSKPENLDKPYDELVSEIEKDKDVKLNAVKYIETRKISDKKLSQLSKNLEREVEVINSIKELDAEEGTIEADRFEVTDVPEEVKESSLSSMDAQYNEKQATKDLTSILTGFSDSTYYPMAVEDLRIEDTSDDLNQKKTVFVKYRTDEGKVLSLSLDFPKIVDKRYFYMNNSKKLLIKQLLRLPIVKTKEDRVEITTNYNKITIERTGGKISRKNAYLLKIIGDAKANKNVEIVYGSNLVTNSDYQNDFEYEELSGNISYIRSIKYDVIFSREEMAQEIATLDFPDNYFTEKRTPIGFNKLTESIVYIDAGEDNAVIEAMVDNDKIITNKISENFFNFIYYAVLGMPETSKLPTIGKAYVYSRMKIFGVAYPVFPVLGLMNGITDILKRYNIKYFVSEKKQSDSLKTHVEVRFKDKYFYYEDTVKNTMLLNMIYMMDTTEYNFSEFDTDAPYMDFFIDKMDQPIYIKNTFRVNLSVMLDPITKDVLRDLKLPTDIIDLLLLANTMLTDNTYRPQNDIRNYRIRGNEVVFAVMYQLIADAYVGYQNAKLNGRNVTNLDIPRDALMARIGRERNVQEHSTLNPVLEMENIASISAKGFRGINLDDAYTLEMRSYDQSMVGFIAPNATPHGNAGVVRALTYNPKVSSVRGYIPENVEKNKLDASNLLSPTELLSSFTSTQADPTRQAMQIGQTKHTMPVVKTHKQLIGSGVNKTMAYMISDDFVFKAKKNGKIEKIDDENKLVILIYDDGTKDAIDTSDKLVKNSNSGFYIKNKLVVAYTEGEKFKKGDAIAYNPSFFSGKGSEMDYQPGTLAKIAIAAGDFAYEDSTIISNSLSEKAASYVTMLKQVSLGANTIIYKIVDVGQEIKTGESLLEFSASFEDPATTEFISKLSQSIGQEDVDFISSENVKSKYTGQVVDVKIFYNRPIEELHESLQKLVRKYKGKVEKRKKALGGIRTESVSIPPLEQQSSNKVGTEEYDGLLIEFYVQYYDEMSEGDKLTYSTALKGVISRRLSDEEAPISDYRPEEIIEAIVTPTGIISRMTSDIYSMIFGNKVLVELGKQIKEIIEDEK
jgi:hypothetical protein